LQPGGVVEPAVNGNDDDKPLRLMKAGVVLIVGGIAALLFEVVQIAAVLMVFGFGLLGVGLFQ
jgi:uncharacterized membrane protein HdeD (DUF308 family)